MSEAVHSCLICQADLHMSQIPIEKECSVCHRVMNTDTFCSHGHFVCDECHHGNTLDCARAFCQECTSRDPLVILEATYKMPGMSLHGPEHHVLVGFALLTAAHNCGADMDWPQALQVFQTRCAPYPGGACCRWGCCGAAVGAGTAVSVLLKASGNSVLPWRHANAITSKALASISAEGGPSCCRRSSFAAIREGARFFAETLQIPLEMPERITCSYSAANKRCLGAACPYHK